MKKQRAILLIIILLLCFVVVSTISNQNKNLNKESIVIKEMSESTQVSDLQTQINQLNASHTEYANYVQSCKQTIATAITNQGVETSAEETLEVMAENIGKIYDIGYNKGKEQGKKVVKLGSSSTYNVSEYAGYENFTTDNFIIELVSDYHSGYSWQSDSKKSATFTMQPTKSYNSSTGEFNVSGLYAQGGVSNAWYCSSSATINVYLIY